MGAITKEHFDRATTWDGEEERPFPFIALVLVCEARGISKLKELVEPGECYHVKVDEAWEAWINPHKADGSFTREGFMDAPDGGVPPFHAWITYNGWLWGLASPHDWQGFDHENPDGANPERFARDCWAAIEAAQATEAGRG